MLKLITLLYFGGSMNSEDIYKKIINSKSKTLLMKHEITSELERMSGEQIISLIWKVSNHSFLKGHKEAINCPDGDTLKRTAKIMGIQI